VIGTIPLLGTLGTLSVGVLLFILAKLSERFGSVIRMRPLYRYYYVALFFVAIGYVAHLVEAFAVSNPGSVPRWLIAPWFILVAHHLPLTIGVTVGLFVTWRYWSWLITEPEG
jgi:hypothetical protein